MLANAIDVAKTHADKNLISAAALVGGGTVVEPVDGMGVEGGMVADGDGAMVVEFSPIVGASVG